MPALAAAQPGGAEDKPSTIRQALGLDAGADEAACLDAISTLRSQFVPVELFADTIATLNAANAALAAHQSEARGERVNRLIEGALKDLKIVPAQRAQYEALCATDAGLSHVATLFANTMPGLRPTNLDSRQPDPGSADTPETLMVRATRYRDAQAAAGIALTHAEAVRFVHENPGTAR